MPKRRPTRLEKIYMSVVASLGCIACRLEGYKDSPAEIHHVSTGGKSQRASHYDVIPLCPAHHRTGGYGVAIHAGRQAWEEKYGSEQLILSSIKEHLDCPY